MPGIFTKNITDIERNEMDVDTAPISANPIDYSCYSLNTHLIVEEPIKPVQQLKDTRIFNKKLFGHINRIDDVASRRQRECDKFSSYEDLAYSIVDNVLDYAIKQ